LREYIKGNADSKGFAVLHTPRVSAVELNLMLEGKYMSEKKASDITLSEEGIAP
jgi:hypothetical protein